MALYSVESPTLAEDAARDAATPHVPDWRTIWIAKIPKGIDAAPGEAEVY